MNGSLVECVIDLSAVLGPVSMGFDYLALQFGVQFG